MLLSVFSLAVDRFVVALLSFVFGLLMRCFGLTPFETPYTATLRVGLCMSPGV